MPELFRRLKRVVATLLLAAVPAALLPTTVFASSHMDAPLIILDPAANTTDVYAFVDQEQNQKSLVLALGVYPFEEPGIGPNKYNFDDNVLYEIHVALGSDVAAGRATLSYQFRFTTNFKNRNTILQSYLGVVQHVGRNEGPYAMCLEHLDHNVRNRGAQIVTILAAERTAEFRERYPPNKWTTPPDPAQPPATVDVLDMRELTPAETGAALAEFMERHGIVRGPLPPAAAPGASETPTPWAVLCSSEACGPSRDEKAEPLAPLWRVRRVYLTEAEYTRQIKAPDARWVCPRCGAEAEWDDETYETAMEAREAEAIPDATPDTDVKVDDSDIPW